MNVLGFKFSRYLNIYYPINNFSCYVSVDVMMYIVQRNKRKLRKAAL